jgi:hypothetical protein
MVEVYHNLGKGDCFEVRKKRVHAKIALQNMLQCMW